MYSSSDDYSFRFGNLTKNLLDIFIFTNGKDQFID